MKKTKYLLLKLLMLFLFFSQSVYSQFVDLEKQIEYYEKRYGVNCVDEKITDNYGNGFESLYGTRNMRTILFGIAYRGGANNFYHKFSKRNNQNPLPKDGLENLCKEGFSDAIYLYAKNYSNDDSLIICEGNKLNYKQISGNDDRELQQIINMVYEVIIRKRKGPIYFHCWNGWHQSGYIAAVLLRQFCGYNDKQAIQYWERNTDGAYRGYEQIKQRIIKFKPYPEYVVNREIQELMCPCNKDK